MIDMKISSVLSESQPDAPEWAGLTIGELLDQQLRELTTASQNIDAADSLTNVAQMALRQQDTDCDGDIAHVLSSHVYPAIEDARNAVVNAERAANTLKQLFERLQGLARETEVARA